MAIADQLSRLNELRQNLADTLTTKGVTAASTEGLETLVPKVAEIEGTTQVQRYEGTFTTGNDGNATVNCGFQPDLVFVFNDLQPINGQTDSMSMVFPEGFDSSKSNITCMSVSSGLVSINWKTWMPTGFSLEMVHIDHNWNVSYVNNLTTRYVAIKYT